MNGVRREDILGRNHWEVYPATVGTPLEAAYRRVLATGETAEFENYYEPWDRWFMVRRTRPGGGLCVHVREVTDAKRPRRPSEKDERLRAFVGHATDYALIMTDTGAAFSSGRAGRSGSPVERGRGPRQTGGGPFP